MALKERKKLFVKVIKKNQYYLLIVNSKFYSL